MLLKSFGTVIKAELYGWDTYFVSQKGASSTTELIQQAELNPDEMLTANEAIEFINAVSLAQFIHGKGSLKTGIKSEGEPEKEAHAIQIAAMDAAYIAAMDAAYKASLASGGV